MRVPHYAEVLSFYIIYHIYQATVFVLRNKPFLKLHVNLICTRMQENAGGVEMNIRSITVAAASLFILLGGAMPLSAGDNAQVIQQSMSETLDLWREGRFEQLFDRLARRGKTSRESFVKKMHDTNIRPACCWQKMENFRLLKEKRTTATAYVKVGLEGTPTPTESSTREFKFTYEDGGWRMQLKDIFDLAGAKPKKVKRSNPTIHRYN